MHLTDCSACRNDGKSTKAGNVSDYTLMVSYVLSFQYYAVFRCTSSSDGRPLNLSNPDELRKCRNSVWDTDNIRLFINSVKEILLAAPGDTHRNLAGFGSEMVAQSANSPWIDKVLSGEEEDISLTQGRALSNNQEDRLKIWFAYKLRGEEQRHTTGHHMNDYDEVYNETDRIVAAVLSMPCPVSGGNTPGTWYVVNQISYHMLLHICLLRKESVLSNGAQHYRAMLASAIMLQNTCKHTWLHACRCSGSSKQAYRQHGGDSCGKCNCGWRFWPHPQQGFEAQH